jgi:hypothetical protein
MTGSGKWMSNGCSRRRLRDRSMFKQIRATIVVNQPPTLSIPSPPDRLTRSHAS